MRRLYGLLQTLVCVALALTPASLRAQACVDYGTYLHVGPSLGTPGVALGVDVAGDHAFVADGSSGMHVVDISDPQNMSIVGTLPRFANDVVVSGDYAFVSAGSQVPFIVDVSDPGDPTWVSDLSTLPANDVAVAGQYAFFHNDTTLTVLDISNPAVPTVAATLATNNWRSAIDIAIDGNRLYLADIGLTIVDISSPLSPTLLFSEELVRAGGIAASGDHAFAFTSPPDLLYSIDISNPSAPVVVATLDIGPANDIKLVGDLLFLASYDGLFVFDVTDPLNPVEVGRGQAAVAEDLAIANGTLYLVDRATLSLFDLSNPTSPPTYGGVDLTMATHNIATSGGLAYVTDVGGLRVVDLGTAPPTVIGNLESVYSGGFDEIDIGSGFAYTINGALYVIDISAPSAPALRGSVLIPGNTYDLAVSGSHAYIASWSAGLQVVDLSDPDLPAIVGSAPTSNAASVGVSGSHAYIGDPQNGLLVVDITDPSAPLVEGMLAAEVWSLVAAGDHVYADGYIGNDALTLVVDVSDPTSPGVVGTHPALGRPHAVVGDILYLGGNPINALDVSDPTNPRFLGSAWAPEGIADASVAGNEILALQWKGLQQLPAHCSLATSDVVSGWTRPALLRTWPNPSRGRVHVQLSLARAQEVELGVYDVAGRRIRLVQAGSLVGGVHLFHWDGLDHWRNPAASGVYFVRLNTPGQSTTQRVTVVR